jgi:hypothetical protein
MGRKSKPLFTSHPKLADAKFGIVLFCAPAGIAIIIEAISIARRSSIAVEA